DRGARRRSGRRMSDIASGVSSSPHQHRGNGCEQQDHGEVSARRSSRSSRAPERHQRSSTSRYDKPEAQHGGSLMPLHERFGYARFARNRSIGADAADERRNGEQGDGREDDEGTAPKVGVAAGKRSDK